VNFVHRDIHLDQEALKLAGKAIELSRINCSPGHGGCNIGKDVAHGSIENQAVDGLVEGLGEKEGDGNEETSEQRQTRSHALNGAERIQLRYSDVGGLHVGDLFWTRKDSCEGWFAVVLEGRDESEVVSLEISADTTVKSTAATTRKPQE
jgi:hypothetical protein